MSEQYYLSLGTGKNQVPLIQAAIKLGLKVIGVDQNPESPGMSLCHFKIQESIFNYRKIFYKLNSLLIDGEIVAGYSASFGKALLSWSYLSEKLRLTGISRPLMERLMDKYEMRNMLSKLSGKAYCFHQPKYMAGKPVIFKKHIEQFKAPFIIKPRTGSGKKEVMEIRETSQLIAFFRKKKLPGKKINAASWIIEEKISGDEVTVTGFVQNFRYIHLCMSDKITSEHAPFIELEHRYPSKHHSLFSQMISLHQEIVEVLQITDTPLVSEWKIVENEMYLIEISLQIPGEYLASFLIPGALYYDYFKNLANLTLGRSIDKSPMNSRSKPAVIKYFSEKLSKSEMADIQKNSDLFEILNENPKNPPESNQDRFAVAGYIG